MKIIVYGLNRWADFTEKAISKPQNEIIGYSDSFANVKIYNNRQFYRPEELSEVEFDYILICIKDRNVCDEIIAKLTNKHSISREKIITIMQILGGQKTDQLIFASKIDHYDGIILGNSVASFGINPKLLEGNWWNLANGSQDIFYNNCVFNRCINQCCDKFSKLKYVVFDLWDYTYLNYDCSLSKSIIYYWAHGGYIENLHNYKYNKLYSLTPDEELRKAGYYSPLISEEMKKLRNSLFDMDYVIEHYNENILAKDFILYQDFPPIYDGEIMDLKICSFNSDKYFAYYRYYEKTWEENCAIIDNLILQLKQINRDIKIIFVMTPFYFKLRETMIQEPNYMVYKEKFDKEMKKLKNKYGITFLDMRDEKSLSTNHYFYYDPEHLNYYGSLACTSYLNSYIKNEI